MIVELQKVFSRFALWGLAASGMALAGAAQANHIDFFESGAFDLTAVTGGPTSSVSGTFVTAPGDALGDNHFVTVATTAVTGIATATLCAAGLEANCVAGPDNDAISYLAAPENTSSLILDYGTGGDLGANLVLNPGGSPWDRLQVSFSQSEFIIPGDSADVTVTLISGEGAGEGGPQTATLASVLPGGGANLQFLYSDFVLDNANLDLADIDFIRLDILSPAFAQFSLNSFERANATSVPVPGALGLLMLGGLFLRRSKRRDAAALYSADLKV